MEENKEKVEAQVTDVNANSMQELLASIISLKEELRQIKDETNKEKTNKTTELLNMLADNKGNKEITIVHNREMLGGLATVLNLSNLKIRFKTLGEQRVLTWQQFEELVSKYRKFFDIGILLLDSKHSELMDKYNINCYNREDKSIITKESFNKLGEMDLLELETYYKELSPNSQSFLVSYWLGKCYEKDINFYSRYKLDTLNRLSNSGIFDNLLFEMNSQFSSKK